MPVIKVCDHTNNLGPLKQLINSGLLADFFTEHKLDLKHDYSQIDIVCLEADVAIEEFSEIFSRNFSGPFVLVNKQNKYSILEDIKSLPNYVEYNQKFELKFFNKINELIEKKLKTLSLQIDRYADLNKKIKNIELDDSQKEKVKKIKIASDIKNEQYLDSPSLMIQALIEEKRLLLTSTQTLEDYLKKCTDQLELIKRPVVLFNPEGDIIYHNSQYSKLNLLSKKCFQLEFGSNFKNKDQLFRVDGLKMMNGQKIYIFNLIENESFGVKVLGNDLGIITSSMAHELNNPIAGVLSALEVLLLDEWDETTLKSLKEMKKSILRCRDLVKIFLGFSKMSIADSPNEFLDIEKSVQYAIDLNRPRLLDNKVALKMEHLEKATRIHVKNDSIFIMLLYTLINEFINQIKRNDLITDSINSSILLKIKDDKMIFEHQISSLVMQVIQKSILIKYLLSFLNFNLTCKNNSLEIYDKL
jgi:hypothetical protein